jgi:hypothetical protein
VTHNRIRDASPLPPICDQTSPKLIYPILGKYAVAPWRFEAFSSETFYYGIRHRYSAILFGYRDGSADGFNNLKQM